jgi:hypothetical protein
MNTMSRIKMSAEERREMGAAKDLPSITDYEGWAQGCAGLEQ